MAIDLSDFWERMTRLKDELFKRKELISPLPEKLISPLPEGYSLSTPAPVEKKQTWEELERIAQETNAPIPEHRYREFGKPLPATTPTPKPSPVEAEPVEKREAVSVPPQPTPTPVQEYYRNQEIADNLGNKDFAEKYDKATEVIEKYAQKYLVPVNLLTDIAFAESSLDSNKEGPTQDVGLFQFTPGTWQETMIRMGMEQFTPLKNRKKPWLNTMAAAYLISQGELSRWNASKKSWGKNYTDEELKKYYSVG